MLAKLPVVGIAAGVGRFVVALFHTIGHLFAALFTKNKGHLAHSLKGCCEMGKGLIESLPIIGRLFGMSQLPSPLPLETHEYFASFFIVKLYNPKKIDAVDAVFAYYKAHPLLQIPEQGCMSQMALKGNKGPNALDQVTTTHFKAQITCCSVIQRVYSHTTTRMIDRAEALRIFG